MGGGILFGYDLGIISGALPQLKNSFQLSCFQQELVVSCTLVGALLGSLFAGFVVDTYGRRSCIVFSVSVFFISSILLAFTPILLILYFSRTLVGFAIALSAASECVYVTELAPSHVRGSLVSLNEVGITIGFLLAYVANAVFSLSASHGWRLMFGSALAFCLVVFYSAYKLPKSPRYLILNNQYSNARSALSKIRCQTTDKERTAVEREFIAMNFVKEEAVNNEEGFLLSLIKQVTSPALLIGCVLVFIQQATGEPNMLIYANTIFEAVGYSSQQSANLGALGLGMVKVVSTVICLFLVDNYGRKTFLIVGGCLMTFSTFALSFLTSNFGFVNYNACDEIGTTYIAQNQSTYSFNTTPPTVTNHTLVSNFTQNYTEHSALNTTQFLNSTHINSTSENSETTSALGKSLSLVFLFVYIAAFSFSFGPLNWIIQSEIYPTKYRGRFFAISTALNWLFNLLISSTFLNFITASGGLSLPFLVYSVLTLLAVLFICKFVPETRGKTLEEIDLLMSKKSLNCNCTSFCSGKNDSLHMPLIE